MSLRQTLRRLQILLPIAALAVLIAATPGRTAEPIVASFFGSTEIRLVDLRRFEKWTGALARFAAERDRVRRETCSDAASLACRYREWLTFLDGLRGASKWEQLVAVNRFVNARPYVSDRLNWGRTDYWATPGEFLSRAGDCEDFAIAKYLSLRELGWTDDDLRVVAVKDENLGIGHAVVVASLDGKNWLLDNQIESVTATEAVSHYRPVYSINENACWLHRSKSRA